MTHIRLGKIKRKFTIRSTLLLKQTSYFVIRAAAFLLLLHSKLKKNVKEDQKIKEEFVRESLRNHPRNVKSVILINHLNQNVKSQNLKVAKNYVDQKVAKPHLNLKNAKNHLHQKVANQNNLKVLKNLISLVKNQNLIKKVVSQRNVDQAKEDQRAQDNAKEEALTHQILDVVTLFLHL